LNGHKECATFNQEIDILVRAALFGFEKLWVLGLDGTLATWLTDSLCLELTQLFSEVSERRKLNVNFIKNLHKVGRQGKAANRHKIINERLLAIKLVTTLNCCSLKALVISRRRS